MPRAADPSTSPRAATSPVNPRPPWSVITTSAPRRTVLTPEVTRKSEFQSYLCSRSAAAPSVRTLEAPGICKYTSDHSVFREQGKKIFRGNGVSSLSQGFKPADSCASLVVILIFTCTAAFIIPPCGINKNLSGFTLYIYFFLLCSSSPVYRVSSGGSSSPSLSSPAGVQGDSRLPPFLPPASHLLLLLLSSPVVLLFVGSRGLRGWGWGPPLGG